jgi:transcription antitermination factor NusG
MKSGHYLSNWYAAYTHSCQEKRVVQHFQLRKIECFLPVQHSVSQWKNGLRVAIEKPLFPGYVFVKAEIKDRVRILEVPGVHSIVGTRREPNALPYEEIEALRRGVGLLNPEPHPFLNIGTRALIRCGPLQGMEGFVIRRKNTVRVVLSIELIMKSISVEVDEADLEIVGTQCSSFAFPLSKEIRPVNEPFSRKLN